MILIRAVEDASFDRILADSDIQKWKHTVGHAMSYNLEQENQTLYSLPIWTIHLSTLLDRFEPTSELT